MSDSKGPMVRCSSCGTVWPSSRGPSRWSQRPRSSKLVAWCFLCGLVDPKWPKCASEHWYFDVFCLTYLTYCILWFPGSTYPSKSWWKKSMPTLQRFELTVLSGRDEGGPRHLGAAADESGGMGKEAAADGPKLNSCWGARRCPVTVWKCLKGCRVPFGKTTWSFGVLMAWVVLLFMLSATCGAEDKPE